MDRLTGPKDRAEFEHNLFLLVEKANHIATSTDPTEIGSFMTFTYPELKKLRKLPNGRIDFKTVDESLRLNANTQNYMNNLGPREYIQNDSA